MKIALTATPALHTTEIFGQPVFKYTYREDVIEGCSSYVINTSSLQEKIKRTRDENPELHYHEDNEEYLKNIMAEIALIIRRSE